MSASIANWLAAFQSVASCRQFLARRETSQQVRSWYGNIVKCLHRRHADHVTAGAINRSCSSRWRMIDVIWWAGGVDNVRPIQRKLWVSFTDWDVGLRPLSWATKTRIYENSLLYSGATGRLLDLRSTGRGFKSYSGQKLRKNLGQVVHTYVPLSPSSVTW